MSPLVYCVIDAGGVTIDQAFGRGLFFLDLYTRHVRSTIAATLSGLIAVGSAQAFPQPTSSEKISISPRLGEITQSYTPAESVPLITKPDFIVIQNVHCNPFVQYAISRILNQLNTQGLLPRRIAVEGAVGPIDISLKRDPNEKARKKAATIMVEKGEMTGAMHFVVSEGRCDLYGVETADLYATAVEMFRCSYAARAQLTRELDTLDAALVMLKSNPDTSDSASILSQDVQVIRHLIGQQLVPEEIHQIMNQAVFCRRSPERTSAPGNE